MTPKIHERVNDKLIMPTIHSMRDARRSFLSSHQGAWSQAIFNVNPSTVPSRRSHSKNDIVRREPEINAL